MKVRLKLFFKGRIEFEDEYEVAEHGNRKVAYAEKREIIDGIRNQYQLEWLDEVNLLMGHYQWVDSNRQEHHLEPHRNRIVM